MPRGLNRRRIAVLGSAGALTLTCAAVAGAETVPFSGEITVPVQMQTDPAVFTPSLTVWLGDEEVAVASQQVGSVGTLTLSFSGSQTQPLMVKDNCPKQRIGVRLKMTEASPETQVRVTFTPAVGEPTTLGAYTLSERLGKASASVCV